MTVLVVGHLCLDIIPTLNQRTANLAHLLIPGKLSHIGSLQVATGGAVANVGLALHRLGIPVRLMGKIGDDFVGRAILELVRGIDPALAQTIIVEPGLESSYTLVISPPGVDRSFLYFPGANDAFRAADVPNVHLARAQVLHVGYPPTLRHLYADGGRELASLFWRAKNQGLTTSLDMALVDPASPAALVDWREILSEVLPYVDIFLPSFDEIFWMLDPARYEQMTATMGAQGYMMWVDGALLSGLASDLLKLGAAVIGFTLAERGLYLRTTNDAVRLRNMGYYAPAATTWLARELFVPAFQTKVVGTTGAGDCAIAGFLTGLLQEWSLARTATFAAAVGACSVEQPDATSGVPRWGAVEERIGSGWPRRAVELSLPQWAWQEASNLWIGPHDAIEVNNH